MLPFQRKIADAGRRAAMGMGAALCLLVGLGFLTAAAFLLLASLRDPLFAAFLIGLAYVGLGLVLIATASRKAPPLPPPGPQDEALRAARREAAFRAAMAEAGIHMPPKGQMPPLAEAFVFGLTVALRMRR